MMKNTYVMAEYSLGSEAQHRGMFVFNGDDSRLGTTAKFVSSGVFDRKAKTFTTDGPKPLVWTVFPDRSARLG
jgi:hypothetical protein